MTELTGRRQRNNPQLPPLQPSRVLLPIATLEEAKFLLPLAEIIVHAFDAQLTILIVTTVPKGEPLSESAAQTSRFREALEVLMAENIEIPVHTETMVRVTKQVWDGIWDVVAQDQIDLLLLAWCSLSLPDTAVGEFDHPRLSTPPCDIVAVRPGPDVISSIPWREVKRILLPVHKGLHSGMALRLANSLACATDAKITLLHATGSAINLVEDQIISAFGPALRNLDHLKRATTVVNHISEAIIEEAPDHQVVVMGAPTTIVHPDSWTGPLLDDVITGTNATLVIAKKKGKTPPEIPLQDNATGQITFTPSLFPDSMDSYQGDRPIAVVVDTWFAENTFHSREFADLERLVALKESQNLTISLGLPALNEAETVGKVIQTIKTALMDNIPLLDEIVLIDSGSGDYTREIASDLGIPVYIHHEILPQYRSYHGKGEALWKSLYVLNGDIIAWIDTDIKNIHPRFVYGVLGPLLHDPNIHYVKGFYRRPLREGNKLLAGGGGRVTELTVRPFFNLFFPELSGVIQPLSGEYAGRRHALEQLPFFTGYGVESGLLIDLLNKFGLASIAQVDLQKRIHHNQPLPSLSKMSFAIMQVVFNRLETRHNIRMLEEPNLTMNLIRYRPRRRYFLEPEEIRERERPPMLTLPEYRQKRGIEPTDDGTDINSGDGKSPSEEKKP